MKPSFKQQSNSGAASTREMPPPERRKMVFNSPSPTWVCRRTTKQRKQCENLNKQPTQQPHTTKAEEIVYCLV